MGRPFLPVFDCIVVSSSIKNGKGLLGALLLCGLTLSACGKKTDLPAPTSPPPAPVVVVPPPPAPPPPPPSPPPSLVTPRAVEAEGISVWQDEFLFAGWRIQRHFYQGNARLVDGRNMVRAIGSSAACREAFDYLKWKEGITPRSRKLVLLLHGLGSRPDVMLTLKKALEADGWDAQTVTYPTTEQGVASNADGLEKILTALQGYDEVSIVAHSLGGLITRAALSRPSFAKLRVPVRNVVMLGTPNQGATLAASLWPFARAAVTAAANDLLPERARQFGAIPKSVRFGVIAGGRSARIGYNPLLLGDNDSIVRTDETKAANMDEWIIMPVFHTNMTTDPAIITAVRRFLKGGTLMSTATAPASSR
jgi:pimeloyl-ACP methyl ester carboxylesterase